MINKEYYDVNLRADAEIQIQIEEIACQLSKELIKINRASFVLSPSIFKGETADQRYSYYYSESTFYHVFRNHDNGHEITLDFHCNEERKTRKRRTNEEIRREEQQQNSSYNSENFSEMAAEMRRLQEENEALRRSNSMLKEKNEIIQIMNSELKEENSMLRNRERRNGSKSGSLDKSEIRMIQNALHPDRFGFDANLQSKMTKIFQILQQKIFN